MVHLDLLPEPLEFLVDKRLGHVFINLLVNWFLGPRIEPLEVFLNPAHVVCNRTLLAGKFPQKPLVCGVDVIAIWSGADDC